MIDKDRTGMTDVSVAHRRKARIRITRKITVTLALATLTYIVTGLTNQPQIWSVTLSVFVGGVILVVQFLTEFDGRLAQVEATNKQYAVEVGETVHNGFAKIKEISELMSLVEASALRTDTITQLIRYSTQLDPAAPPLALQLAQAELSRMSQFLMELAERGSTTYEGEDRDWLLTLARRCEASIDATSLTTLDSAGRSRTDGELWSSDLGQRYLEVQREALRRGVRIRRVFVVLHDGSTDVAAEVRKICRPHLEIGVDVRVLDSPDLARIRPEALVDIIIFDDAISQEVTAASRVADASPAMLNTHLELRPERVKAHMARFADLWESARALD